MSLSKVALAGAPRSFWKLTFQLPSTVNNCFSSTGGNVTEVLTALSLNITNTASFGSNDNATVVIPFAMLYDTGSVFAVSGCQSTGTFPLTRKFAFRVSFLPFLLFTQ